MFRELYFPQVCKTMNMQVNFQFQHYLDTAIIAENANKGILRLMNARKDALDIVAQRGFDINSLICMEPIKAFDATACGRVLGTKNTVIIDDVETDVSFKPFIGFAHTNGFRSLKCIPIIGPDQQCLGIISVHFMLPQTASKKNPSANIIPSLIKLIEHTKQVSFHA
jgi:GAF domain-containing protein